MSTTLKAAAMWLPFLFASRFRPAYIACTTIRKEGTRMATDRKATHLQPRPASLRHEPASTEEWQEDADSATSIPEETAAYFEQQAGDEVDWYEDPASPEDIS